MKSKRTIYPVVSVTFMLDTGLGSIEAVGMLHGSYRQLEVDAAKGKDVLSAREMAHVAKVLGRLSEEAVCSLSIYETEIIRDDFGTT